MKGKRFIKVGLSFALVLTGLFGFGTNVKAAEQTTTYPNVQSYQKDNNKTFTIGNESRIYVIGNERTLNNDSLLNDLKLISSNLLGTGVLSKAPNIVFGDEDGSIANDIVVKIAPVEELTGKEQSYKIVIDNKINVIAQDEIGIYYGLMTVIQMLKINDNIVEQGIITDYPDVKERSMHLDIARKYFTIDWIKDLIRDMSLMKMNSLQIHFSENEGFRLESDFLNSKGFTYPSQYYTKEDMAEIVNEAKKYHIDVIPSLDSPGHLRYILNQFPQYSCSGVISDSAASRTFNVFNNEEAKEFLFSMMDEFSTFFGDLGCTKMNIGGDEFLDNFSVLTEEQYSQVMTYFNEVSAMLKSKGMTARAWNDGLRFTKYSNYTLDSDIEICYWSGGNGCATIAEFVEAGHKVMSYIDVYMYYVLASWWDQWANPNAEKIYNEWYPGKCSPSHNNGTVTDQTYTEPYPDFLLGNSFALWCDTPNYKTEDQIRTELFERMRVVGEKAWNTHESMPSYAEFKQTIDKLGRPAGYQSELPEPGEVYYEGQTAAVTLKYVDTNNKQIANDEVYYGLKDKEYNFEVKDIYGYRFIEASDSLSGVYQDNITITLTYESYCDKTELAKEINNQLITN
ncbi:MAG: family 20 glycosylhydrolase, partial [Thomasclavelia sp.]|uniref:family 20 glycosylhydrolase n=1 Tax=Thomasclavelia sp. TaxID=3025757 RepID=UPI0039A24C6D